MKRNINASEPILTTKRFRFKNGKISQGRDSILLDLKIVEQQGEINSDRGLRLCIVMEDHPPETAK